MEELVLVGNGMAGIACLEQILKHEQKFEVTVFGDETHVNYNRILLSSVLAGERSTDEITLNSLEWYQSNGITLRLGVRITDVDPVKRIVRGDDGSVQQYDRLLLATGSRAFLPPISDLDKENVFTFRNLDDTRAILDAAKPGAQAVVIGGGLLSISLAEPSSTLFDVPSSYKEVPPSQIVFPPGVVIPNCPNCGSAARPPFDQRNLQ